MANDIVKEILLKFKSDSKDVNRDMATLQSSLKNIEKTMGGQQGASSAKLFKSFKEFSDSAKKMGSTLSSDFSRIQKVIQSVATKDLSQLSQRIDQMAVKAETRLKRLNELESGGGASPHQLMRQRQLAMATDNRLSRMMNQYTTGVAGMGGGGAGGGGGGGGMGGFGGMGPLGSLITGGSIGRLLANASGFLPDAIGYARGLDQRMLTNPAIANQPAIQQRLASYRGDLTMGVLARKGATRRAQEYAERQTQLSRGVDYGNLLMGGLATIGGAGLMAAGGIVGAASIAGAPITMGTSTLGLGVASGLVTAGGVLGASGYSRAKAGGSGVIDRIFANKTEAERARSFQEGIEAEKSRLIDDDLYKSFYEKAPERAAFRRRMGASEDVMADARQVAARSFMTPEEQMSIASNLRGTVGSSAAMRMSLGVGRQALRQGMDAGTMSQLQGVMATGATGGSKQAEKNMEEMFTRAVSAGFTDTGIREELMKMAAEVVASGTSRTDAGRTMDRLLTYLPKDAAGEDFKRLTEGAKQAAAMDEARSGGEAPIDDAISSQVAIRNLRKMGKKVNMTNIEGIKSLTVQDLTTGSDKTSAMGLSEKDRMSILSDREEAMGSVNPDEAKAMAGIRAKAARGEPASEQDLFALGSAMISADRGTAGLRAASPEAIRARARARITRGVPGATFEVGSAKAKSPGEALEATKAYDKEQSDKANDSSVDLQAQEIFRGGAKQEADQSALMTPGVTKQVAAAQREANKATATAGDQADPKQSAESAVKAMESFSGALDKLTTQINRMSSGRSVSGRPGM